MYPLQLNWLRHCRGLSAAHPTLYSVRLGPPNSFTAFLLQTLTCSPPIVTNTQLLQILIDIPHLKS